MKIIVTGGMGFIGSAVVRHILMNTTDDVLVIDKLTYAGNINSLKTVRNHPRFHFEQKDICHLQDMHDVFETYSPDAVMHLAAESHVDRSISSSFSFIQTNIIGTYTLLEAARQYYHNKGKTKRGFRFHHISTDEVYGDLQDSKGLFTETTPYNPSSPYSASKAASDHLVRAWLRTFKLPTIVSNCSNNYGPFHFPEKLIPLTIINALQNKTIPVYGNGQQIRDWLFVEDHAAALYLILMMGKIGETYNIGGCNERKNIEVVQSICTLLNELKPRTKKYEELITFVEDRPGHDTRYAIDATKMQTKLGWTPKETFESGLLKTIEWFLENEQWWQSILDGSYNKAKLY